MKLFYSRNYTASAFSFDTTRKADWIADSLRVDSIPGVTLCKPEPVTESQLHTTHSHSYVNAVRSGRPRDLAESQGFSWDYGLWGAVCASTGGVVAAALTAMREGTAGSLSSGLHHARRGHGNGFCTFNGLVVAAYEALRAAARSVLIIDLDAHCGGGTHSLIAAATGLRQIDVSVCPFDGYEPMARHTLDIVRSAGDYLGTVARRLKELETENRTFDLCLYNAGMDPDERCSIGGVKGIDRELLKAREQLVFKWCRRHGLPIAFVMAGGYTGGSLDERALVDLHRLTIEVAAAEAG